VVAEAGKASGESSTEVTRVRIETEGRPVPGVEIRPRRQNQVHWVETAAVHTDAEGLATIAGKWSMDDLLFEAEGFRVDFVDDSQQGLLAVELARGVSFTLVVLDRTTDTPIRGARALVTDWGEPVEAGPTGANGEMRVFGVMDDNPLVPIVVQAEGYASLAAHVETKAGRAWPRRKEVKLQPAGIVRGRVLSPSRDPVAGASIVFRRSQGGATPGTPGGAGSPQGSSLLEEIRVSASGDGTFATSELALGVDYVVRARARGFASSGPVRIRAPDATQEPSNVLELALRTAGRLTVTVQGTDGKIRGDEVNVTLSQQGVRCTHTQQTEAGSIEFGSLDPGNAVLRVVARDFLPVRRLESIREGERQELLVQLDPGAAIRGKVVDQEGAGMRGVHVEWKRLNPTIWKSGEWESTRSASGGIFRIGGLSPGERVLIRARRRPQDGDPELSMETARYVAPDTHVRILLAPAGSALFVLRTPEGDPFHGEAWLVVPRFEGFETERVRIRAGAIRLQGLYGCGRRILIAPSGYAWLRTPCPSRSIRDDAVEITLDRGVDVTGVVEDADGHRIPNAAVTCDDFPLRRATSDPDGRFRLEGFPPEQVILSASAKGYARTWRVVRPGSPGEIRLRLYRGVFVRGRVRTAAGDPVHSALVEFRRTDANAIQLTYGLPHRAHVGSIWLATDDMGEFGGTLHLGDWRVFLRSAEGAEFDLQTTVTLRGEPAELALTIPD
jgi:hypothetical protein